MGIPNDVDLNTIHIRCYIPNIPVMLTFRNTSFGNSLATLTVFRLSIMDSWTFTCSACHVIGNTMFGRLTLSIGHNGDLMKQQCNLNQRNIDGYAVLQETSSTQYQLYT